MYARSENTETPADGSAAGNHTGAEALCGLVEGRTTVRHPGSDPGLAGAGKGVYWLVYGCQAAAARRFGALANPRSMRAAEKQRISHCSAGLCGGESSRPQFLAGLWVCADRRSGRRYQADGTRTINRRGDQ